MFNQSIFASILGLSTQWCVIDVRLAERLKKLYITVGASTGAHFDCPVCNGRTEIVSEEETRWLHENLFNLRACITAFLPMISCHQCGIKRVPAPWEKPHSQFVPLEPEKESL